MTDGPGLGDLFVRRLLNLPGQSCGPSGGSSGNGNRNGGWDAPAGNDLDDDVPF
ncbi:hypothetical protein [Acetobacter malorum]|uniref:hypothetical protein n=1 Tax=Acetobacter malorum TaxID=178901 RepID=UPI000A62D853|nr:hypothetical protein [Acetobacter malorum]